MWEHKLRQTLHKICKSQKKRMEKEFEQKRLLEPMKQAYTLDSVLITHI